MEEKGDPLKNGLGHEVAIWRGMKGVWVPDRKKWRVVDTRGACSVNASRWPPEARMLVGVTAAAKVGNS